MMINHENPWGNMGYSSQRRVDSNIPHNIFWMIDVHGKYGFYIRVKKLPVITDNTIKLKGISIIKRPKGDFVQLFLILNDKEDWQIFYILCKDLIEVAMKSISEEKMIDIIEIRLKRWQELLKKGRNNEFSVEKQMGLYSELLCLRDIIIPEFGPIQAIKSWVGPDSDKQDFLLEHAVIEVKSYKTSKGEMINISSKEQLFSEKDPFYLQTYALTFSDTGSSVEDIVLEIKQLLSSTTNDHVTDIFEDKLMDYGYIPELITEPLQKFVTDKQRTFYVSESFPRISPRSLMEQIINVKYTIDLSKCRDFETELNLSNNWERVNISD